MSDVPISRPNFPELGGAGPLAFGTGTDQRNRLADTRATSRLLVTAVREILVHMDNIGDACPVLLNDLESANTEVDSFLVITSMTLNPTVAF